MRMDMEPAAPAPKRGEPSPSQTQRALKQVQDKASASGGGLLADALRRAGVADPNARRR
jgi:hypothetical protein